MTNGAVSHEIVSLSKLDFRSLYNLRTGTFTSSLLWCERRFDAVGA